METLRKGDPVKEIELSEYNAHLEKKSSIKPEKINPKKVLEGYRKAKAVFDESHNHLSKCAAENRSMWRPEKSTLTLMHRNLMKMKEFHKYAKQSEIFERVECCKNENFLCCLNCTEVTNIIVDVIALIVIIIEEFNNEPSNCFVDSIEEVSNLTTQETRVVSACAVTYLGIVAVLVSVIFSKTRLLFQHKAEKIKNELALLSKVLGDSKLLIQEYKNKLSLWEKTTSLYELNERKKERCLTSIRKRIEKISKEENPELYEYVERVFQFFKDTESSIRTTPTVVDSLVNSPVSVETTVTRKCGQKTPPLSLTVTLLQRASVEINFARRFIAVAIEEVNKQAASAHFSRYSQSREVIEEEIHVLESLFDRLDKIPKWIFQHPSKCNNIIAVVLGFFESIALTTLFVNEFYKEIHLINTTLKVEAVVIFFVCAIISAVSSFLHKKERQRLDVVDETNRILALRWILKDLNSILVILKTHERWNQETDDVTREKAFLEYFNVLEDSKRTILGLQVKTILKKLTNGDDSLPLKRFISGECRGERVLEIEGAFNGSSGEHLPENMPSQRTVEEMREIAIRTIEQESLFKEEKSSSNRNRQRRFNEIPHQDLGFETETSCGTGSDSDRDEFFTQKRREEKKDDEGKV